MFNWIQLLWHTTNLRVVILFSLFLQTFLFFSAPLRKRTSNSLVTIPIWLAYNLADATAIFGVGLISKPCGNALGAYANPELMAFWAPFLLLHLGGPDTITAFALEDNELWLRHLLQLVVQLATSAYVFILTLSTNNQLWLPTLLIFVSALIKSIERNSSLYLASWRRFRDSMLREPNPGPNYHTLMDEYFSNQESGLPSRPEIDEAHIPEPSVGEDGVSIPNLNINLLKAAYHHFKTVKGLIADLKFTFHERNESRSYFVELTAKQAFECVTIELNFLYDILFTKTPVIHGYHRFNPIRFVSFVSCLVAFVLFHSMDPKHKFLHHKIDVEITYTLLLGTIVHDVIAFFVISTSDWTTATSLQLHLLHGEVTKNLIQLFLPFMWALCYMIGMSMKFTIFYVISIMQRGWSGCISQYNLIFYCLHPRSKKWDKLIMAGTAQIRFRDTCAEDKLFFQDRRILEKKEDMIQACNSVLDVHTVVNPSIVKGDTSKTVFFDSCILAKELKKLNNDKWKILSKVWVELLSYAACRSNANSHATHLSKGGQLISLVWLLMVHLGLGDWFEVSEGHQRQ